MKFNMLMCLVINTLILSAFNPVNAFFGTSKNAVIKTQDIADNDMSIGTDISVVVHDSVQKVMSIVNAVQALPACERVASASLVHACSTLDGSSVTSSNGNATLEWMIEGSKSVYAARLAVCELINAGNAIPKQCSTFTPTAATVAKRGLVGHVGRDGLSGPTVQYTTYDDLTEQSVKACTIALGTKPQWWTSYSNAKQNSVSMCHAMRIGVEKGELAELYATLFESLVGSTESLADYVSRIGNVFDNQLPELEDSLLATTDFLSNIEAFMTGFGSTTDQLEQSIKEALADIKGVTVSTKEMSTDLAVQHQVMDDFFATMDVTEVNLLRTLELAQANYQYTQVQAYAFHEYMEEFLSFVNAIAAGKDASNETLQNLRELKAELATIPSVWDMMHSSACDLFLGVLKTFVIWTFPTSVVFACLDVWGPFVNRGAFAISASIGAVFTYAFLVAFPSDFWQEFSLDMPLPVYWMLTTFFGLSVVLNVLAIRNIFALRIKDETKYDYTQMVDIDTLVKAPVQAYLPKTSSYWAKNDPKWWAQKKAASALAKN